MTNHFTHEQLARLIDGSHDSFSQSHLQHLSDCENCQKELESLAANQAVWGMAANYEALTASCTDSDRTSDELHQTPNNLKQYEDAPQPISSLPKSPKPEFKDAKLNQTILIPIILVVFFALAVVSANKFLHRVPSEPDDLARPAAYANETIEKAQAAERAALERVGLQQTLRSQNGPILKPPKPPVAGTSPEAP